MMLALALALMCLWGGAIVIIEKSVTIFSSNRWFKYFLFCCFYDFSALGALAMPSLPFPAIATHKVCLMFVFYAEISM